MTGPALEENLALIQTIFGENSRAISTLTRLLQTPYSGWTYWFTPVTPALLKARSTLGSFALRSGVPKTLRGEAAVNPLDSGQPWIQTGERKVGLRLLSSNRRTGSGAASLTKSDSDRRIRARDSVADASVSRVNFRCWHEGAQQVEMACFRFVQPGEKAVHDFNDAGCRPPDGCNRAHGDVPIFIAIDSSARTTVVPTAITRRHLFRVPIDFCCCCFHSRNIPPPMLDAARSSSSSR